MKSDVAHPRADRDAAKSSAISEAALCVRAVRWRRRGRRGAADARGEAVPPRGGAVLEDAWAFERLPVPVAAAARFGRAAFGGSDPRASSGDVFDARGRRARAGAAGFARAASQRVVAASSGRPRLTAEAPRISRYSARRPAGRPRSRVAGFPVDVAVVVASAASAAVAVAAVAGARRRGDQVSPPIWIRATGERAPARRAPATRAVSPDERLENCGARATSAVVALAREGRARGSPRRGPRRGRRPGWRSSLRRRGPAAAAWTCGPRRRVDVGAPSARRGGARPPRTIARARPSRSRPTASPGRPGGDHERRHGRAAGGARARRPARAARSRAQDELEEMDTARAARASGYRSAAARGGVSAVRPRVTSIASPRTLGDGGRAEAAPAVRRPPPRR